ncbi:MAG: GlsB/YeaQ/YmgE family stress response membrane protein [Anaerolineae bacterium]|nr:GlsB/YeaQ/YmgE family stress response membrane protein [Anaerolineae bacterium]
MGILSWIIFGALAGWIASMIMGRNEQQGCIMNIIVGVIGASIGGWIMSFFGFGDVSGFNLYSFGVAMLGAVVLLFIVNLLFGKK